ncbi:hypothetical protein Rumeso_01368 [Rubellimicrobium mesophilum DSM 19309]|uniref:Phage DNA packaging protein Nu1 n=2 Tax=Rubellimicrobium TaxID=295418 RepID=A0A017HTQ6_9RHOB|nr:hypothetical protein Rumeso_01368 [Rubellimicrobium mesophilum DSM 19309]
MGVRTSTIREWEAAGCPVERKAEKAGQASLYRAADVIAWDRERAVRAATGDMAASDLNDLRKRKLAAEVILAELILAEKQGQLVRLDIFVEQVAHACSALKSRLLVLPAVVAPSLTLATTTQEFFDIVYQAVIEALEDISSGSFNFFGTGAATEEPSDAV